MLLFLPSVLAALGYWLEVSNGKTHHRFGDATKSGFYPTGLWLCGVTLHSFRCPPEPPFLPPPKHQCTLVSPGFCEDEKQLGVLLNMQSSGLHEYSRGFEVALR